MKRVVLGLSLLLATVLLAAASYFIRDASLFGAVSKAQLVIGHCDETAFFAREAARERAPRTAGYARNAAAVCILALDALSAHVDRADRLRIERIFQYKLKPLFAGSEASLSPPTAAALRRH